MVRMAEIFLRRPPTVTKDADGAEEDKMIAAIPLV